MSNRETLSIVVQEMFADMASDLRVCLPAKIHSYDAHTMLASVQPLLRRQFYLAETPVQLPIINNVPVIHPRSGTAMIRFPIKEGDIVTLVFSDRSIEKWKHGSGEEKYPDDTRMHHLSDAYAIPGGYPKGKKKTAKNPEALEIVLEPGTKITIGNGTDELLAIAHASFTSLKSLCDRLADTLTGIQALTVTCSTAGSPSSVPINAATFSALKTQVDSLASSVNSEVQKLGNLKV
jgi:hypothetical protein